MKALPAFSVLALACLFFSAGCRLAAEHPAEAAEAALTKAKAEFAAAEKRFQASAAHIADGTKRELTLKAFKARKELWMKLSDADADLKIAISLPPDTSTSTSLIPYWTEVHYLKLHTAQLKTDADWIDKNWK